MAANKADGAQKHYLSLCESLHCKVCVCVFNSCLWFQVYIWVLNDEEDFQRAFDLGATGVMTDFPTRLREFLDLNGISKPR